VWLSGFPGLSVPPHTVPPTIDPQPAEN